MVDFESMSEKRMADALETICYNTPTKLEYFMAHAPVAPNDYRYAQYKDEPIMPDAFDAVMAVLGEAAAIMLKNEELVKHPATQAAWHKYNIDHAEWERLRPVRRQAAWAKEYAEVMVASL